MAARLIDLIGKKFGFLTVIARGISGPKSQISWHCRCDCGAERVVRSAELRKGRTKSCGCAKRQYSKERSTTHGRSKTREYGIWRGMINRCTNQNVEGFSFYGGAGVKVCSAWLDSFERFYADMGPSPSSSHSIDRFPDTNGDYEPTNCRWATVLEQANNRRHTRRIIYRGKEMSLCDAVRLAGGVIHHEAAWVRIKSGWDIAEALETPRLFVSHASKERRRDRRGDAA